LRARFIANGQAHPITEALRRDIVVRFERIDAEVPIASSPTDGLFLAEMLLNTRPAGAIVECGCYAGGSSAKLSILAKITGRELVVCDSFEGLPTPDAYSARDRHVREVKRRWTAGRYGVGIETVVSNVTRYGEPSTCRFVKGWFEASLTGDAVPDPVAFVFSDVDLPSSARTCLVRLWPRLAEGGVYVTHDSAFLKVLVGLHDRTVWTEELKAWPPILFGAGYGLCDGSPHVGYMVKGGAVSVDDLKALTIVK
jgi:O-methyltransferase